MSVLIPATLRRLLPAAAAAGLALALTASPAAAARKVPRDFYGITPATPLDSSELAQMGRARVGTIRVPFFWPHLQPADPGDAGSVRWEEIDPLVLGAAENGIEVLPFVYGTPDWVAGQPTAPPLGSGEAKRSWKRLLDALQQRYGPGGTLWEENPDVEPRPIRWWQIWNEPNSRTYWKPTRGAPERYARLLEISDKVLEAGPGRATVVAAGLFGSPTHGMYMHRFLRQLYDVRGVEKHFDVVALHPYGPSVKGSKLQMKLGRREIERAGDERTPIWVTEIGWPTDGHPDSPYYTTRKQQAQRLRSVFDLMLENRRRWNVDRVIWYTWRDNDINPECDLCRYAGLFDAELNPKPSWEAFVEFTGGTP